MTGDLLTPEPDTWAWYFEPDGTLTEATETQIIGGGYVVDGEMYKLIRQ